MLFVNAVLKISAKSSCRFVSATGAFNGALGVAFLLVQIAVAPAALGTTPETTTATMTSLSISAAGSMATSVASGTVVTLTAKVTAGGKVVSPGQVDFCDAEAKYCEDIHLLATVQLTKAGVAVYKFRPGIGSHTYKAEFRGTKGDAASASGAMALTVTGRLTTVTGLTEAGFPGEYSLIASVAGVVNKPGYATPSGKVSFVDTSSANRVLASMSLGSSESSLGFFVMSNPAAGFEANSIATADFNGDGIPDLVVTNSATYNSPDVINILIGVGNGTFTEAPSVATSAQFRGTAVVGDFNGDGIPDIAVTNNGDVDVSILLGNGDGTFKAAPNVITNSASSGIVVGDFNHDGIADLGILTSSGIQIFLGKGDGTLKAVASPVPVTGIPIWIVVGDFNRDGNEDLAVTNDSSVSVYLGDGNGVFKAVPGTPNEVPSAQGLAIGDFNGDGIPDLAAVNYGVYQGNAVAVMIGNGDGTFKAPKYYPAGDILDPLQAVVTDLNGDDIADLVVASAYSGYEAILLGNGDGTFTPAGIATGGYQGSGSVAIADFNGDGIPDLAVPDPNPESTVSILLTQPTRTVSVTVSGINPAGPGTQEVIASYPGDGLFKASVSTPVALTPAVNTPVISPASGTYTTVQKVTIAESTPGATIYYSVSGTTFTDGFVEYTGPFFLPYGGFEQVSAYATETGAQHSDYTTTTYNLNFTAAPKPVFSPAAGSYKVAQTVTITDAAPNAVIYYTTNGSYPTLASTVYAGPVTVSTSQLVSAVAIAPGYSVSDEAGAQYLIGSSKARFVYTVAGTQSVGYSGDGGPATFASLEGPSTVARDANGNLYIADSYTVRKIAAGSGIISTVAGDGLPGYSGDGAAATKAKLGDIGGLAVDGAGDLYISDETYDVVRRVAPGTGTITTIAGNGKSGDSGDSGPATKAALAQPAGMAVDKAGNLYIGTIGSIRKVAAETGTITTFAGTGAAGYSGNGVPATNAELGEPSEMVFDDSGNLYFADGWEDAVRRIAAGTSIITTVAGTGPQHKGLPGNGDGGPATSATLAYPQGLAIDSAGDLFISDSGNGAVREVTATSKIINTIAGGQNSCGFLGGDGGPALAASLCYPGGLAIDQAGNLYVTDSSYMTVREITVPIAPPSTSTAPSVLSLAPETYSTAKTLTITAAPGSEVYLTLNGAVPTTRGQGYYTPIAIDGPVTVRAIALEPGRLPSTVVTAAYNVTAPAPAIITTVAGSGGAGSAGSEEPALEVEFGNLGSVAADSAGNLYIADPNNGVVWKLTATTQIVSVVAGTPGNTGTYSGEGEPATKAILGGPAFVALDPTGDLFISDWDNARVYIVSAKTGIITTYAGGGQSYAYPTLGDGGLAVDAVLETPQGIAFDKSGNLYIADPNLNRIRRVDAATGIITTAAGATGATALGDGGPAKAAMLRQPANIAFDGSGNLYIADQGNARIREVSALTGIITTVAGNGIFGSSGDGGPATHALIYPWGIAVDPSGNIYFSNADNTVRMFAPGGDISTIVGTGYWGFAGDGGPARMAELCGASGLEFDKTGNLYIADGCNYRVRKVHFPKAATARVF